MRITGGSLRGRDVPMPSTSGVRPTPARVREALFSMLGQDLDGWSALDGCAGAGMLGLEALSRGASPLTLCERNGAVVKHLRRVVAVLGVRASVVRADARVLLGGGGLWDLVLLDPPYGDQPLAWLEAAAPATRACLVLEYRAGPTLPRRVGQLELDRQRGYGDTAVAIYRA